MNEKINKLSIIKPDDWHIHLRENEVLNLVLPHTVKNFARCIAMPNLNKPIIDYSAAKKYSDLIIKKANTKNFRVFVPYYLNHNIDLKNFEIGIKQNYFFGAKLYPSNSTTNSKFGVNNLEKIYPALEILQENNSPLLIHAEKVDEKISIFDREKYFIDNELQEILKRFQNLKIVIEHISSEYGAQFVNDSSHPIASTVTLHHMLLTKKDVFNGDTNPHHYCMPVVKNEKDLIALRKFACSGNKKFFLGTDSAPHDLKYKEGTNNIKAGIYTSPIAIEMYTSIFEEENSLNNLETFSSINGANFYDLPLNSHKINIEKVNWINPDFTEDSKIKIKNFMGGQKIKWKVVSN